MENRRQLSMQQILHLIEEQNKKQLSKKRTEPREAFPEEEPREAFFGGRTLASLH